MSTKINTIISDVQSTFASTPSVQTQLSGENSTQLASIGYVSSQALSSSTYLDKTSIQTITGNYSITNQPTITTIDTPTATTLNCGATTDTLLTITYVTLRIKTFLQNLSNYLAVGNLNLVPASPTGIYVSCQKIQTGQVSIAASNSVPVTFNPPFSTGTTPCVLISVQNTTTTVFTPRVEYVTLQTNTGFTANYDPQGQPTATVVLNWMAIGT